FVVEAGGIDEVHIVQQVGGGMPHHHFVHRVQQIGGHELFGDVFGQLVEGNGFAAPVLVRHFDAAVQPISQAIQGGGGGNHVGGDDVHAQKRVDEGALPGLEF